MGGVFVGKIFKRVMFLTILVVFFHFGGFLADKALWLEDLGNWYLEDKNPVSESQILDALLITLQQAFHNATKIDQGKLYLKFYLPKLQEAVWDVFAVFGSSEIESVESELQSLIDGKAGHNIRFYFFELLEKFFSCN